MSGDKSNLFVSLPEAAAAATRSVGLDIGTPDIKGLLRLGLLPNFGTESEPLILEEHARLLAGRVASGSEVAFAALRAVEMPTDLELEGHQLVQLSGSCALSFDLEHVSASSVQTFIRALRRQPALLASQGDWARTLSPIENGPCVWAPDKRNQSALEGLWHISESREARTTTAESLCVPMLYGSKARVSSFIVSCIRQHLEAGAPICDVMAGTGLITRHLLAYYRVHANDAALFAKTMAASQALHIDQERAEAILKTLRPAFEENMASIRKSLGPALSVEEDFLLGGLSAARLVAYRDFTLACTRFVPRQRPSTESDAWRRGLDTGVRAELESIVQARRGCGGGAPYVLATCYWGNCYFGLQQAAEIDSLVYAIRQTVADSERPLIEAVLLASADACASGPHYAQPPQAASEAQIRQLIEKRAKSVWPEFRMRLLLSAKRAKATIRDLTVSNLPWREALGHFTSRTARGEKRGIYIDPPYSRLQYSRYYHVFDTLLRYDYPECVGEGRTSERSKRFSSRFDCRESAAVEEFRDLFREVCAAGALCFLSYSTGGTVPLDTMLRLARERFGEVVVYAVPLQHHSQGVPLRNRGHRLEVLLVGLP